MRALITGGAGFLASHICDALLSEGHSVVAVDNLLTGRMQNLEHLARESRFEFKQLDICHPFDCGKVDHVFHLAAPTSPKDYIAYGIETLRVGSAGTFTVLELAQKYLAKFTLASGSAVYGDAKVHPQSEDYWGFASTISERSVYTEAKRLSEVAAVAYRHYLKVDTRIARIFYTYGPRMKLGDGRAISTFMEQALKGKELTIYGDGSQRRSFCYVSEVVDGILRLAMSDVHGPVNLGYPEDVSVLDCARTIIRVTNSPSAIGFRKLPPEDPKRQCPDITKARTLLGWQPKMNLEQGLKTSLDYFRNAASA
jgi:dTDP-glucose 4,6-dehydratase